MTWKEQLRTSVETLAKDITSADFGTKFGGRKGTGSERNLRLDLEIDAGKILYKGSSIDEKYESILLHNLIVKTVYDEVEELIIDGDVLNPQDAWLKSINGLKVMGKEPVVIDIPSYSVYREFRPNKEKFEYTLYMILKIEW